MFVRSSSTLLQMLAKIFTKFPRNFFQWHLLPDCNARWDDLVFYFSRSPSRTPGFSDYCVILSCLVKFLTCKLRDLFKYISAVTVFQIRSHDLETLLICCFIYKPTERRAQISMWRILRHKRQIHPLAVRKLLRCSYARSKEKKALGNLENYWK